MKEELFAELMDSAEEALSHAKGKRELRTTVLPVPPAPMKAAEVKKLRERVRASQSVFAHYLNVSTKLVQAWESHRRIPEGAALKLLRVAQSNPALVFGSVSSHATTSSKHGSTRIEPKRQKAPVAITETHRGFSEVSARSQSRSGSASAKKKRSQSAIARAR